MRREREGRGGPCGVEGMVVVVMMVVGKAQARGGSDGDERAGAGRSN